jgi:glycosyltransferase involved in cell wall biosynthesis
MPDTLHGRKIKVCLVAISLGRGGAERSTALLSQMLVTKGYDVSLIILNDWVAYEYAGTLYNVGRNKKRGDSVLKRWQRFAEMRRIIKKEKFDVIIDNRTRVQGMKEWLYLKWPYRNQKLVYVVRSFNLDQYFPQNNRVATKMVQRASAIIGVSKAIAAKVNSRFAISKAISIYNPMEELAVTDSNHDFRERYILFLGRIEESVKNFSLLLASYKASVLLEANIRLKIVGEGPDSEWLQEQIKKMGLQDHVSMLPFTPEVGQYLKNALYLTLTSRYEGFPRVLIEALSMGTPVVSVDCDSGPNEIIQHEKNGLLVPNHDEKALTTAMNRMATDEAFRKECASYAKKSIEHLQQEHISKLWDQLIQEIITN